MQTRNRVGILLGVLGLLAIFPASAGSITFCGTGQASCGGNGASLGSVAGSATSGQDLNWAVTFSSDGTHTPPGKTYVAQPCGNFGDCGGAPSNFPFGSWVTSSTNQWISPFTADTNSLPAGGGEYDYTQILNLSGVPSGAALIGDFATDNCLMGIYVNGTLVEGTGACTTNNNFGAKIAFDITSAFIYGSGNNTVTFKTQNVPGTAPNPAGLLVEVTSTSATPEPATLFVMGLGLAALGLAYRGSRRV